jgi:hypothetical protein
MPLTYVTGDPLLTHAQTLAFGHNTKAQNELSPLQNMLYQRYPTAFAAFRKQCRAGRLRGGDYWLWRETAPQLLFLIFRDSASGATRLRYVDSALLRLAQHYTQENIHSLALVLPEDDGERLETRLLLERWLITSRLPIVVYEGYLRDVAAEG